MAYLQENIYTTVMLHVITDLVTYYYIYVTLNITIQKWVTAEKVILQPSLHFTTY